ncbi:hypothetical protein ACFV1F_19865 [Streptomyces sp. NPDC059590]
MRKTRPPAPIVCDECRHPVRTQPLTVALAGAGLLVTIVGDERRAVLAGR